MFRRKRFSGFLWRSFVDLGSLNETLNWTLIVIQRGNFSKAVNYNQVHVFS